MPLYDYQCCCGHTVERVFRINERPKTIEIDCLGCNSLTEHRRIISGGQYHESTEDYVARVRRGVRPKKKPGIYGLNQPNPRSGFGNRGGR